MSDTTMLILTKIIYILIFPGLLFSSIFGLWLAGMDRKVIARMQRRVGPPVVQPFYDFFKLLGKETIVPAPAAKMTFLLAPYVGLVSLIVTVMFIPIAGIQAFSGMADTVVILYLLTIPALSIIFGGSASGSPFAGVGISRTMVSIIAYELPLILIILAVGKLTGVDGRVTFSFADISQWQAANGPILFHPSMIPAAVAMLFVIPCEVGAQPFDAGEAETEICEGPLVEYSGTPLAVFKLSHAIKMFVMTALFTALFLGGISTGYLAADVVIVLVICTVVTLLCMTLVHAITARLKIEHLFKFYWTAIAGLALVSLVLVWFGI